MAQKLLEEHPSKKIILSEIKSMKNLDLRKVEGKGQKVDTPVYIFVESSGDLTRSDARIKLSQRLMKKKIYSDERISKKSTEPASFVKPPVNDKNQYSPLVIVYKSKSGGMQETTLNSTITELFPLIAFESGISERLNEDAFYNQIQSNFNPKSSIFVDDKDAIAGKKFIEDAERSSQFNLKIRNAIGALKYLKQQNKGKKIAQVKWGYRRKPTGVNASHRGDIFVKFDDGKMLGLSLKAGGAGTKEPKFNTYVSAVMNDGFGDSETYALWQKESYEKYYKQVPGILDFSFYGKDQMVDAVAQLEFQNNREYERLYNEQLDWLRGKLIDYMMANPDATKQWLLNSVAAVDENVPTLLVKLVGDKATVEDDENILAECVQRSKKGKAGLKVKRSPTSKQNIIITLKCRDHDTKFQFSVRTNQVGAKHKLGQFIRLAFKYNGVVK